MAYSSWSVVFGEQPSAAKWNILGTNDSAFNTNFTRAGMVVQVVETDYSTDTSGNTVLPSDNTIPQKTEGFEVMTQAITPIYATSNLLVQASILVSGNTGSRVFASAIFRDSTAAALAATAMFQTQSSGDVNLNLGVKAAASSTSATTFKIRLGSDNAGTTVTFGGGRFDTIPHSYIRVTEIAG